MKNKISIKLLSFLLTIAMVLSMIPFGSIPFVSAADTELCRFTNTGLKIYSYQTDNPSNRWMNAVGGDEYATSTSASTLVSPSIWAGTQLGFVADNVLNKFSIAYSTTDLNLRANTVVVDLGAWYNISKIKVHFDTAGGGNFGYRLRQQPATIYTSSASTIEEVRDFGFKSYYSSTRDITTVRSAETTFGTDTNPGTTYMASVSSAYWKAIFSTAVNNVRFVAIDTTQFTQSDANKWGPLIADISIMGSATTDPNGVTPSSISVANIHSFNLGDDVCKALATSGAVVKDQGGTTLSPLYKFEGLHTSKTGTRTAIAWVGPETSSVDVPSSRKTTFSYTVSPKDNNVSLNQTYSTSTWQPQMSIFRNDRTIDTANAPTLAGETTSNIRSMSGTTYYPFIQNALAEHLVDPTSPSGTAYFNMRGYVYPSSTIGTSVCGSALTNTGYFVIDLQKDYNVKMVQFTAMANIIMPKLRYLTEAQGANIVTGGQAKIGTATSPSAAAPFTANETLDLTTLDASTTVATADNASLGIADATDYGNYNSKDTIVAFKSVASQTPADSGQRNAVQASSNQVNATGTAEVTNSAVGGTARYIIIENQSAATTTLAQIAEIKVWADTVQQKLGLRTPLSSMLTRYNANGYSVLPAFTYANTVAGDPNATQEQVDTAAYNLFMASQSTIYSVTWNADGGLPAPTQTSVIDNGTITAPATMTKTGYTFGGWYYDAGLTQAVTFPVNNVTSNQTFYAKWTINSYSVTWNVDGGSPAPTQTSVIDNGTITAPATMTKTGYTFGGWYSDAGLTQAVTFPVNNVTSNQTFYAKWTAANVVNKTALLSIINAVLLKKQIDYTSASWTPFATALTNANSVYADANAGQTDVDNAASALVTATNNLVLKPKYMLGDVFNDGKIDATDIAAIVLHITRRKLLTDTYLYQAFTAADVNRDGKIDGKDIAAIIMHITKVKQIVQPV